jgi:hypothetical protein
MIKCTCNYFRIENRLSVPVPNPDCGAPLRCESGKRRSHSSQQTQMDPAYIYIYFQVLELNCCVELIYIVSPGPDATTKN